MTYPTLELRENTLALLEHIKSLPATAQIYILPHHRADGDAYGSAFALDLLLGKLHFKAQVVLAEAVPDLYNYLDFPPYLVCSNTEEIQALLADLGAETNSTSWQETYCCLVDNSEPATRLGVRKDLFMSLPESRQLIIDHHVSSYQACKQFDIAPEKIACCEQVAELALACEKNLEQELMDQQMANFLMTGIITDSGQLNYAAVSSQTYLLMAWLKSRGAQHELINNLHFHKSSLAKMQLQAYVVNNMEFAYGGRLLIANLPIDYVLSVGATEQDIDGISAWLREVEGVEAAALLRSTSLGNVLGSLRSNASINVQSIAATLGGGGHVRAAGFTLYGMNLTQAQERLLEAAKNQFEVN